MNTKQSSNFPEREAGSKTPSVPPLSPRPSPIRLAMVCAYEGSRFQGWQIQSRGATLQGRLEEALRIATGSRIRLFGSGRTDSGVHAFNQVAHFDIPRDIPRDIPLDIPGHLSVDGSGGGAPDRLRVSLDALAGPHISVKALVRVPAHFHARHSAIGKTYRYHIFNRPYPPVFARERSWWLRRPLDAGAMAGAAEWLEGSHDFSAFRAADCSAASPVRTIRKIDIELGDWPDGSLRITIEATGFLMHMARIMAGTLVGVGHGRLAAEDIPAIIDSRERSRAGDTAPARGLHLLHVQYDLEEYPELREFEMVRDCG